MLAQIFVLFALVSAVLSAKNLREESSAATAHGNDKHAAALFHSMMKKNVTSTAFGASLMTKLKQAAGAAKVKKNAVASNKAKLAAEPYETDGYLIERVRPNSDCSGVSVSLTAHDLGGCHEYEYYDARVKIGCRHSKDGKTVDVSYTYYESHDCTGPPFHFEQDPVEKCSTDYEQMESYQCAPDGLQSAQQAGGIVYSMYHGSNCQGAAPSFFSVKKFGTCDQKFDYSSTSDSYSYVMMTGCTQAGIVTMAVFTDPACERLVRKYEYDIRHDEEYGPSFNSCNNGERTVCIPPTAHHHN